ncbi:MAG: DUF4199 domain-containing protein [Saprospirales bacterium]|nr:MAG: DUF4199 domain-containing protein [Saprospirales bacterium]
MKFKHEFHWALYLTLASAVWLLIANFSGLHSDWIEIHLLTGDLWFVPALPVIWMSVKKLRDGENEGLLSFWQGVQSGTLVVVMALPLILILHVIYYYTLGDMYFDLAIVLSVDRGMDPTEAQMYFNLPVQLIRKTFSIVAAGFILSMFVSMFLKKQDDDDEM